MTSEGVTRERPRAHPAAPPRTPHVFALTVRDTLFAHWPVDPDRLRSKVPDPLELETRDGDAWLGVVPFVLVRGGVRGSPRISRLTFPELAVRTYVRYRGDRALFFFSVDVGSAVVAMALDRLTRLPVNHAKMQVSGADERTAFSSHRSGGEPARFSATYRPEGDVFYAEPGSLEAWLTARRRFYAPANDGVMTGEVGHAPWPLRPAEVTIHENGVFGANDLPEPTGEPIAHYCGELAMTGSIVRRLPVD